MMRHSGPSHNAPEPNHRSQKITIDSNTSQRGIDIHSRSDDDSFDAFFKLWILPEIIIIGNSFKKSHNVEDDEYISVVKEVIQYSSSGPICKF